MNNNNDKYKILKSHCNNCLQDTNHFVLLTRSKSGEYFEGPNDQFEVSWSLTYKLIECCGCENVTLIKDYYFSEWDESEIEYYPPLVSRHLPKWHKELPPEWTNLLKEIYTSLHANSRCLSLMGARALIDLYLTDQLGDIGGFDNKMKELFNQRKISKQNKEVIESVLDAGNAAAHRNFTPNPTELKGVMDIIENLLQSYTLINKAKELKKSTPQRKKTK